MRIAMLANRLDEDELEYPHDAAAERRLICCLMLGLRDPTEAVFCELQQDDFFCWPCDVFYHGLRAAWQQGRLKNTRQTLLALTGCKPGYMTMRDWCVLAAEIVNEFRWPLEGMWRSDLETLLRCSWQREEIRLLHTLLGKTRGKHRYPGECLHLIHQAAERLARKVERC